MPEDANTFRSRLTPLSTGKYAGKGATVDERRSGNVGRDGYAVLDQARPAPADGPWGGSNRNRRGLTPRVWDGANRDYTE